MAQHLFDYTFPCPDSHRLAVDDEPKTMLKTSPILSSSPGTPSSAAFRHASSLSSHDSPRQSVSRRTPSRWPSSSAGSMKSPAVQARVKRAGASASTLSSSSSGTTTTSGASATDVPAPGSESNLPGRGQQPNPHSRPHPPPPSPPPAEPGVASLSQQSPALASQPTPLPACSDSGSETATKPPVVTPAPAPASAPPVNADQSPASRADQLSNALSPGKRRGSPAPSMGQAVAAASGSSSAQGDTSSLAKRPKPERASPKLLPQRYELCAVEDIVELIAHMLAELITTNDAIGLSISNGRLTRFHSRTAPGISVRDYLHRLARHATLTPPLLLAMVYYIDRLCSMYQDFTINTLTVHRFLITAATVAAKGLSDAFWNNTTYARVGGVRVAELKLLELEFLSRVDWRIVPNPEELVAYYRGLVERTPGYELEVESSSSGDDVSDDTEDLEVDSDV